MDIGGVENCLSYRFVIMDDPIAKLLINITVSLRLQCQFEFGFF